MRDQHTSTDAVLAIAPATVTAAANGNAVDLRGANACAFTLFVDGTGDTLSPANRFVVGFDEADADANGNPAAWTPVDAKKVFVKAGSSLSIEAKGAKHAYGVTAIKRFVRMTLAPQGTHTAGNGIVAVAVRGHLQTQGFGW